MDHAGVSIVLVRVRKVGAAGNGRMSVCLDPGQLATTNPIIGSYLTAGHSCLTGGIALQSQRRECRRGKASAAMHSVSRLVLVWLSVLLSIALSGSDWRSPE